MIDRKKLQAIRREIDENPKGLGYPAFDPSWQWSVLDTSDSESATKPGPDRTAITNFCATVAGVMNAPGSRDIHRTTVSEREIIAAIDGPEFVSKTPDQQMRVLLAVRGSEQVDPFGLAAHILLDVFGPPAQSTTLQSLAALRTRRGSRAEELGIGFVKPGNVRHAMTLEVQ